MESKGGCCIARCATQMDRIMLRFRPIAPKPDASSSQTTADAFPRSAGGAKRRRANGSTGGKRCSRPIRRRNNAPPQPTVTLPLLPETPDPKQTTGEEKSKNMLLWLSLENRGGAVSVDPCWCPAPAAAGSVVTVECVTDTWQDEGLGLGFGDEDLRVMLVEDTCPGFISDGYGRVTWTNGAYKEVVGGGGVWLAMKMTVPDPYRGFTCRVRVQYACGKERTVPCDVWRMATGGFAWRLDVKAALSLSLAF